MSSIPISEIVDTVAEMNMRAGILLTASDDHEAAGRVQLSSQAHDMAVIYGKCEDMLHCILARHVSDDLVSSPALASILSAPE